MLSNAIENFEMHLWCLQTIEEGLGMHVIAWNCQQPKTPHVENNKSTSFYHLKKKKIEKLFLSCEMIQMNERELYIFQTPF